VQLNAGGRQVASNRGWSVVDFERLASWFADPKVRPQCAGCTGMRCRCMSTIKDLT